MEGQISVNHFFWIPVSGLALVNYSFQAPALINYFVRASALMLQAPCLCKMYGAVYRLGVHQIVDFENIIRYLIHPPPSEFHTRNEQNGLNSEKRTIHRIVLGYMISNIAINFWSDFKSGSKIKTSSFKLTKMTLLGKRNETSNKGRGRKVLGSLISNIALDIGCDFNLGLQNQIFILLTGKTDYSENRTSIETEFGH